MGRSTREVSGDIYERPLLAVSSPSSDKLLTRCYGPKPACHGIADSETSLSYNFAILAPPIPESDQEAWDLMDELTEREVDKALPVFHTLVDKLTEKHPCLCDLSDDVIDDLGVWSDGPLRNNIFLDAPVLGLASHRSGEVLPFVIRTANSLGLTLFDFQTETIYRPEANND